MAMQTIFRNTHHENYTVLSNELINAVERGLDLEASALLSYLLAKPKDWKVYTRHLVKALNYSAYKIRQMLRTLRTARYVIMERLSSGYVNWFIYDTPQDLDEIIEESSETAENTENTSIADIHSLKNKPFIKSSIPTDEPLIPVTTEIEPKSELETEAEAKVEPEKILSETLVFPTAFNPAEQQQLANIIIDAPLDLQKSILSVFVTALKTGSVKLPLAYLKALVSKANVGLFEKPLPTAKLIATANTITEPVDTSPPIDNLIYFTDVYNKFGGNSIPKDILAQILANQSK